MRPICREPTNIPGRTYLGYCLNAQVQTTSQELRPRSINSKPVMNSKLKLSCDTGFEFSFRDSATALVSSLTAECLAEKRQPDLTNICLGFEGTVPGAAVRGPFKGRMTFSTGRPPKSVRCGGTTNHARRFRGVQRKSPSVFAFDEYLFS
jgi:hypothetical protein